MSFLGKARKTNQRHGIVWIEGQLKVRGMAFAAPYPILYCPKNKKKDKVDFLLLDKKVFSVWLLNLWDSRHIKKK